jgi:hypothetical protein
MRPTRRLAWVSLGVAVGLCTAIASCRSSVEVSDSPAPRDAATPDALVGLIGCDPTTAGDPCVRAFITRVGQRAWRRPLTSDEVSTLDAVYAQGRADFDVPTSVQMVVQMIRTSPSSFSRAAPGVSAPAPRPSR